MRDQNDFFLRMRLVLLISDCTFQFSQIRDVYVIGIIVVIISFVDGWQPFQMTVTSQRVPLEKDLRVSIIVDSYKKRIKLLSVQFVA